MRFQDICGHNKAISTLREIKDSGNIPHAIMFSGPSGIGKMRLARAFVQYILCERPEEGDSCGICPSCRRFMKHSNPDIHYVFPIVKKKSPKGLSEDCLPEWFNMIDNFSYMPEATWLDIIDAGNSQPTIYVNQSDRISEIASLSTYADRYKIFIIWLPEKMQPATANKLLKIIEEPFEDTIFIAVSNSPSQVLPTITSRMRRFELSRPSTDEITQLLISSGALPSKATEINRIAKGNVGMALELLERGGEYSEFSEFFMSMMRNSYARKVYELKNLSDKFAAYGREKSLRMIDYFAGAVRENFIANLRVPALNAMTAEEQEFSSRFAPFINHSNVESIISALDIAKRDISRNANSKLVWFDFLLQLMTYIRKK